MIQILAFSLVVMTASCSSNSRKMAVPVSHEEPKGRLDSVSCDERLKLLIVSCSNYKTPFDKHNLHAEIDEEQADGVYRIRLFVYDSGVNSTNTVGWVVMNTKENTLKDITNDPDSPVILNYNQAAYTYYVEHCLGRKVSFCKDMTLLKFFELLPVMKLPFEYSYDFVFNLPDTKALKKSEIHYISSFVDTDTDLSDCHVARLPPHAGYHFILIFAHNSMGEGHFFLCALNGKYQLTDRLLIYTAYDMEWKDHIENCYLHYLIDGNGQILLRKIVTTETGEEALGSTKYAFVNGKFVKK